MSVINSRILDESLLTIKFGINGGLTVVRALSYDKLMALSLEDMKQLFQPSNSTKIRRLGLESIVNGNISKYRADTINDFIDLTELASSISSQQFINSTFKRQLVDDLCHKTNMRNCENKALLDIVIQMFENNELDVSIVHPIQFGRLFNTRVDDTIDFIAKRVLGSFNLVQRIYLVKLGYSLDDKVSYFVSVIFPSIIRAINTLKSEGQRIRGCREITKHRRDILNHKHFEFTPNEQEALVALLDRTIEEAAKYDIAIN